MPRSAWIRLAIVLVIGGGGAAAALIVIDDPLRGRAAAVAILCLALWLGEAVPAFVPTLLLLALAPWSGVSMARSLTWAADPVLALFFGGFVLAAALARHGIDRRLVAGALTAARGSGARLVGLTLAAALVLSMWMSNVAAAALLLAALKPALDSAVMDQRLRRALLLAVAFGAGLGGMATPISSGPNAIAIAAMDEASRPGFARWMAFATPLAVLMAGVAWLLIVTVTGARRAGPVPIPPDPGDSLSRNAFATLALGAATIAAWLSEPWHGIDAPIIALVLATTLFCARIVDRRDLARLDWETLILIAGGIALGRLLEHSGLTQAAALALADAPPWAIIIGAIGGAALGSAVMSNTATATMLIPIAATLDPHPPTLPILVALACSFGLPFVISTPPNAMAVGAGLPARNLLVPGVALMLLGCALLALTGPWVLGLFGLAGH